MFLFVVMYAARWKDDPVGLICQWWKQGETIACCVSARS